MHRPLDWTEDSRISFRKMLLEPWLSLTINLRTTYSVVDPRGCYRCPGTGQRYQSKND